MQTLVIGIGNAWRGDDAAGLLVVHALRVRDLPHVVVAEVTSVDTDLIDLWQGADRVILVDAVVSGAAPGTVHCFDLGKDKLPVTHAFCSTHALDLVAVMDLARVLDRLPSEIWVFGVEASDFIHGHPVSTAVLHGLNTCVETIVAVIHRTA
jgi:hydrogenase maturation protease